MSVILVYCTPIGNAVRATKMAVTTTFIVNGDDYFAANLNNGGIRVGLKGVKALDIPSGNSLFAEAAAISTEAEAEAFFDEYVGGR